MAQTGDILLFTGTSMQSQLLRTIMRSNYDHVGLLVKYPKSGQLIMLESLQGKGVCRWDWNTLSAKGSSYWRDNYSKVVYRRLMGVERDDAFVKTV